jgi:hypothetical protein
VTVHVSQTTLLYVIDTLAIDHKIPIGWEKSSTHKNEYKINIDLEGVALREVLDSIVQQEPSYQWQIADGVINITPTYDKDAFVTTFLDMSINRFPSDESDAELDIRDRILKLPTIDRLMISYGMQIDRLFWGRGVYVKNDNDLSISNMNVRGILNKLIRVSPNKTWFIERSGKNNEKLLISF